MGYSGLWWRVKMQDGMLKGAVVREKHGMESSGMRGA